MRVLKFAVTAIVIEAALLFWVKLSPAFGTFMRPVYVMVGVAFGVAIWRAARKRDGGDRRHGDRRHSPSVD
jgi:hypothetical protein